MMRDRFPWSSRYEWFWPALASLLVLVGIVALALLSSSPLVIFTTPIF